MSNPIFEIRVINAEEAQEQAQQRTGAPANSGLPQYDRPVTLHQILTDYVSSRGIQEASSIEVNVDSTGETIVIHSTASQDLNRVFQPSEIQGLRFKTQQSAEAGR